MPWWVGVGNYQRAFADDQFWVSFLFTLKYTAMITPVLIVGGYLLALIVPYQALLTPMFLLFARVGLTNTLVGLAVLHTTIQLPFSLYVLRNSLSAVPRELEEAAVTDGASSWQVLVKVMIPSTVPAIVTVALFAFIMSWNEFLGALVMMSRGSSFTLPR